MPITVPVVDWNQLHALSEAQADGEPDVVAQIIAMFQKDCKARMSRVREALQRGDERALRLEAHSLRGTAGVIGASPLLDAAAAVEQMADSGDPAVMRPLVEAMAHAVNDVRQELSRRPASGPLVRHVTGSAERRGEGRKLRVLIADDDRASAAILGQALKPLDVEAVVASNGTEAWDVIRAGNGPSLAVLDWMMPDIEGPELCRRIRRDPALAHMYVILLTSRNGSGDIVAGLDAGADEFLSKPFNAEEVRARVMVGSRVLGLQQRLAARVAELQSALSQVKQLSGLLPICSYCKRIRNDDNYWEQVDKYVGQHSAAQFTHGICPSCLEKAFEVSDDSAT